MPEHSEESLRSKKISTLSSAIVQIILIDFIFSIDSILTAIGMTNGITPNHNDALILMIIAVVISIIVMMIFANPIRKFIHENPSHANPWAGFPYTHWIYAYYRSRSLIPYKCIWQCSRCYSKRIPLFCYSFLIIY